MLVVKQLNTNFGSKQYIMITVQYKSKKHAKDNFKHQDIYSKLYSPRKLMTFISGYRVIFNLFKLDEIYNLILCNTMVLSSTIIIVSLNDRVWPRNAIITACRPTHGTVRKGHKVGIIQALTVQYIQLLSKIFIDSHFCHNYLHTLHLIECL